MKCLYCLNSDTKVTDSRIADSYVRRRRECLKCSKRFTTYEKAQAELTIIKKDGSKEIFDKKGWEWSLYRKFCVVRNPYDRVVSLYHHFCNTMVKERLNKQCGYLYIFRRIKDLVKPTRTFKDYVMQINTKTSR